MIGSGCRLASGAMYRKGVRKEYRMMTDNERNRFHAAMWTLKRSTISGEIFNFVSLAHLKYSATVTTIVLHTFTPMSIRYHTNYVFFWKIHSSIAIPGTLRTFWPRVLGLAQGVHQEVQGYFTSERRSFLRFEIALRLVDPSLSLPYWDTTLEGALADVKYSCLWCAKPVSQSKFSIDSGRSTELMGDTMDGPVDTGAFRGWTNIDVRSCNRHLSLRFSSWLNVLQGNTIVRNLGQDSARVLNANDRNLALAKTRIDGILAYTSPRQVSLRLASKTRIPSQDCPFPLQWDCMEFAHGYSHVYVGGWINFK